jgi:GT2 family glycosyltransferase
MVELMLSDPEIGMSSCRLEQRDGTLDRAAKRSLPTLAAALYHFLGLNEKERFAQYRAPELGEYELGEVDAVNGSYMLIRKERVEQVGLLDEGYWLSMDDLDWRSRFKQAGWKVVYDGGVSSMHVKGGTTKKKAPPRAPPQRRLPPLDGSLLPQVRSRPQPAARRRRLPRDRGQTGGLGDAQRDHAPQHHLR